MGVFPPAKVPRSRLTMRFSSPWFLLLILLIPLFLWRAGAFRHALLTRREKIAVALRAVIVLALILSLAGMTWVRLTNQLAVVFLIDASDSVPASAQAAAQQFVQQALEAMGPDDQAAIIVFGQDALVERSPSANPLLGAITSVPITSGTDLAGAIRLGTALYPSGPARRMVILSDGLVTAGDSLEAARLAAASGIQIESLPFSVQSGPEVFLTEVEAPARLRPGEIFDLRIGIQASHPGQTGIRILANGRVVYQGAQDLNRGGQTLALPLQAGAGGAQPGDFIRYSVQITPQADTWIQNNQLSAISYLEGPPRILVLVPPAGEPLGASGDVRPEEGVALISALESAGYSVDRLLPPELPSELPELAGYDSIVLVDVPAREMSNRQMAAVQTYVRDLGGGLVVVGGPTSYGVGGYFRTSLEDALPVDMEIKDEQRRPSLAIVFVIDHSGSMAETSGGPAKVELAKEATMRSVELLFPSDQVGVVAFDDSASWVVPLTTAENQAAILNAIGSIRAGGGTDILAGLNAVSAVLPQTEAHLKHIILLTDGGADPAGLPELVSEMNAGSGITLSTVGIGRDAAPFLKDLAALGGGRYHFTADPAAIPQIFTEETSLASRAYIEEHEFFPELVIPSAVLSGINETPPLLGYVATSPKDAARVILQTDKGDPLLATWQYGLGRATAFTSDASGRWALQWIEWAGFPTFWAQVVAGTIGDRTQSPLQIRMDSGGEGAVINVDAHDPAGSYLNGYNMEARIVDPDGDTLSLSLDQVAPGRYTGRFTPQEPGAYFIAVAGSPASPDSGQPVQATQGWVQDYSPEYRLTGSDPALLARVAAMTGGSIAGEPQSVFEHSLPAGQASIPAWPWLLGLAVLLFPLDIAVRRLVVTPADLRWGLDRVRTGLRLPRRAAQPSQPARSERLTSLFEAKRRVLKGEDLPGPALQEGEPPAAKLPEAKNKDETATGPDIIDQEKPSSSTAARLLEAKRRQNTRRPRD